MCKPIPKRPVTPTRAPKALSIATSPDVGVCALLDDGTLRCWGRVAGTNLGPRPVSITAPKGSVEIALGKDHACVRTDAKEVWCWGRPHAYVHDREQFDQLNKQFAQQGGIPSRPVAVAGLTGVTELAAGDVLCARTASTIWCSERSCRGYCGPDEPGCGKQLCEVITGDGATELAAAGVVQTDVHAHTLCAVRRDGRVVCSGFLPTADVHQFSVDATPTLIAGIEDAVEVRVGYAHACARRRDGSVACWGANVGGSLGDATEVPRERPVTVQGVADAVEIEIADYGSCARTAGGAVVCWPHIRPVPGGVDRAPATVVGIEGAVELAVGDGFRCARTNVGTVLCWGRNEYGQLGDGTKEERPVPVQVRW